MAFKLITKLILDGKGMKRGFDRVKVLAKESKKAIGNQFSGLGKMIAGAFTVGAIAAASKEAIDYSRNIELLSEKFGTSRGFMQKLSHAAKMTGLNIEGVGEAYKKMHIAQNRTLSDYRGQMKKGQLGAAFKTLGVTIDDVKNAKPEDLFRKIGKQLKYASKDSQELHDAMNTVFGRKGSDMLNLFGGDLEGLMTQAEELGIVLEDATIQKLDAAGKKLEELKSRAKPIFATIALGLVDVATDLFNTITKRVDDFESWANKRFGGEGDTTDSKKVEAARRKDRKGVGAFIPQAGEHDTGGIQRGEKFLGRENFARLTEEQRDMSDDERGKARTMRIEEEKMLAKARMKAAQELKKIQQEELKRRFKLMTPAQQMKVIQDKMIEQQRKILASQNELNRRKSSDADVQRNIAKAAKEELKALEKKHGSLNLITSAAKQLEAAQNRMATLEKAEIPEGQEGGMNAGDIENEIKAAQFALAEFVQQNQNFDVDQVILEIGKIRQAEESVVEFKEKAKVVDEELKKSAQDLAEAKKKGNKDEIANHKTYVELLTKEKKEIDERLKREKQGYEDAKKGFEEVRKEQGSAQTDEAVKRISRVEVAKTLESGDEDKIEQAKAAAAVSFADAQMRLENLKKAYGGQVVQDAAAAQERLSKAERNYQAAVKGYQSQIADANKRLKEIEKGELGLVGTDKGKAKAELDAAKAEQQRVEIKQGFATDEGKKSVADTFAARQATDAEKGKKGQTTVATQENVLRVGATGDWSEMLNEWEKKNRQSPEVKGKLRELNNLYDLANEVKFAISAQKKWEEQGREGSAAAADVAAKTKMTEEKQKAYDAEVAKLKVEKQKAEAQKSLAEAKINEVKEGTEGETLKKAQAQKEMISLQEQMKAVKDKEKKQRASMPKAGKATFDALAKIGGRRGLQNTVLTTAKKQLDVAKESNNKLIKISNTLTNTFEV